MQPASLLTRRGARVSLSATLLVSTMFASFGISPVAAADPARRLAAVRAEVDQLANRYFAARTRLQQLDAELARLRRAQASTERSYAKEHRLAVRRAVARYTEGAPVENGTQGDASSVLQAASTSVLVEHAAQTTNAAMARYAHTRASLLDTQRRITQQRRAQQAVVTQLAARTRDLNVQLAAAQRAYREMLAARAAAAATKQAAQHHTTTTRAKTPTVPPVSTQPVDTPAPPPPAGTYPHHNDPFLSCVRHRESNGFYGAVNSGGYYGAYQFAITTWDITASHAGRPDLIGVRPDHASPWDQDQLAWVLYQWQGMAPWGGGC